MYQDFDQALREHEQRRRNRRHPRNSSSDKSLSVVSPTPPKNTLHAARLRRDNRVVARVERLPKVRPGFKRHLADAHCLIRQSRACKPTSTASDSKPNDAAEAKGARSTILVERLVWILDDATGIIPSVPPLGTTLSSNAGCKTLPLGLVRAVEYESVMRLVNWTEMDISKAHALLHAVYYHDDNERHQKHHNADGVVVAENWNWYRTDIRDNACAKDYLMRASLSGNRFARRALTWLSHVHHPGKNDDDDDCDLDSNSETDGDENKNTANMKSRMGPLTAAAQLTSREAARDAFVAAIRARWRDRAVALGRLVVGWDERDAHKQLQEELGFVHVQRKKEKEDMVAIGRRVHVAVNPAATQVLGMRPREQKAMAANNIGFLLQYGNDELGLAVDMDEAVCYYEMAIAWGCAAAPSNLAHLVHTQYDNGSSAFSLYHLALERGERNHAPRNLALLLSTGAPDLPASITQAAHFLLLGIHEGDDHARHKARKSLATLARSWRFKLAAPSSLRRQCAAALRQW